MPELDEESRRMWEDLRRGDRKLRFSDDPMDLSRLSDMFRGGTIRVYAGIPPDNPGDPSNSQPIAEFHHGFPDDASDSLGEFSIGKIFAKNLFGQCIKIADVPPGLLTPEIAQRIMQAYLKKGAPLTVEEVMSFYQINDNKDDR